jgi:hypothetical protein
VFDPTRATDLIDLWNLRLELHPVLPVPVEWFEALEDDIHKVLKAEHRPVVGNPHGVMHSATIEFGRSIPKPKAEALIRTLLGDKLPRQRKADVIHAGDRAGRARASPCTERTGGPILPERTKNVALVSAWRSIFRRLTLNYPPGHTT